MAVQGTIYGRRDDAPEEDSASIAAVGEDVFDIEGIEDEGEGAAVAEEVSAIVGRLEGLAQDQADAKVEIEQRWYDNLRAYHGRYDANLEAQLKAAKKSRQYIKKTRSTTLAWEARLSDLLFPTEDKNWGIQPTPIPEMKDRVRQYGISAQRATDEANRLRRMGDAEGEKQQIALAREHAQTAMQAQQVLDEAKKRADSMSKTLDDQLVECNYNVKARDAIHDYVTLGTSIMKGPVTAEKRRRSWRRADEGAENSDRGRLYTLIYSDDERPDARRVDPWNYFPDMNARTHDECDFEFERIPMTERGLRRLARRGGYDKDAIRALLEEGPQEALPDYFAQLREITGKTGNCDERYLVWEYHGRVDYEELVSLLTHIDRADLLEEIADDVLEEYPVIITFCQGRLLKFGLHPLDSGDSLYSVSAFEKDDSSLFGFGVPELMAGSQASLNGAWRMILDNASLSVGPQIVVDQSQIEPADGSWEITARKVWKKKTSSHPTNSPPFEIHNIPNNQTELMNIVNAARQFADEESNMPMVAQGEPGTTASTPKGTSTMGGLAMIMNSVNVVFRRVVKNWDDDMTEPMLTRFYDWNMQFNPDESIKGDMTVDARGSSVLLVREMQAQNLMMIASQWSAHPVLGQLLKIAPAARKAVQALMIASDDIIKSDDELEREAQQQQQQGPSPDELKLIDAREQREHEAQMKSMEYDMAMMELAEKRNMQLEDIRAKLGAKKMETDSKERILAAETAVQARERREAAMAGQQAPQGGGGYV